MKALFFRSKVGIDFLLGYSLPMAFPLYFIVEGVPFLWIHLLVITFFISLLIALIQGTYYRIDNETLEVVTLYKLKWVVNINSIVSIEKSNNPMSSPALAIFDRIKIVYDNGSLLLSPRKKKEFIKALKVVNTGISLQKS